MAIFRFKCACGEKFQDNTHLRIHIALSLPRWPQVYCTKEHHDPESKIDTDYIKNHPNGDVPGWFKTNGHRHDDEE